MDIALLVLRVVIGVVFVFHGGEKLGLFGGEGVEGTARFFARQGFRPPRLMAIVAAVTELSAAVGLALGLLTPLAGAALLGVTVNIGMLHVRNGLSRKANGFEYELVLASVAAALAIAGAGRWSLDHALGLAPWTAAVGLGAVALGVVSGLAVSASRRAPDVATSGPAPSRS